MLGTYFASSLQTALKQSKDQREAFEDHNAIYPESATKEWMRNLTKWYDDPDSTSDPFEEPATGKFL